MAVKSAAQIRRARGGAARWLRATPGLLALPAFGWWLLFFVAPLALLVVYSFGQIDIITFQVSFGWTLENYAGIADSLYLETILRSVLLAAGATAGCLVLGFPVAFFMSRQSPRIQQMLLIAVVVPFWASFVIRTYAWINVMDDGGPIHDVVRALGLADGSLGLVYTPLGLGIGMTATYLPLMILPLFVALDRIDSGLLHSAADLGANPRRTMIRVVLPLAKPGIFAGCLLVGVPSMGEYVIPAILGGGKTLMLGNVIAEQFLSVGNYPFGAALATAFMAVLTGLLIIGRRRYSASEPVTL